MVINLEKDKKDCKERAFLRLDVVTDQLQKLFKSIKYNILGKDCSKYSNKIRLSKIYKKERRLNI